MFDLHQVEILMSVKAVRAKEKKGGEKNVSYREAGVSRF